MNKSCAKKRDKQIPQWFWFQMAKDYSIHEIKDKTK